MIRTVDVTRVANFFDRLPLVVIGSTALFALAITTTSAFLLATVIEWIVSAGACFEADERALIKT